MGLGEANVARAAQFKNTDGWRVGAFNTGPLAIERLKLRRRLALAGRQELFLKRLSTQRQMPGLSASTLNT